MDRIMKKVCNDVEEYGCSVLHIFEGNNTPCFTYSIGITEKTGQPEMIVTGLRHDLAHFIVNEYNRRIKEGEQFVEGKYYSDFIGGFDVTFREVDKSTLTNYTCRATEYYGSKNYRVLQMIFPSTSGLWPWDDQAPEAYLWNIPKLY